MSDSVLKSSINGGQMVRASKKGPRIQGIHTLARQLRAALFVSVLLFCCPPAGKTETIVGELSQSHASFLVSAARFANWPADAFPDETSPLVFCVYKDPETGMALQERLQGETIKGRSLRKVDIDTLEHIAQCHIVYLPASRIRDYPVAGQGIHGVLSISDCREFAESDGMLGFIRGEQGVDVIINVEALNVSGMSISPSLLQMAELVKMDAAANRTIDR